MLLKHLYDFAHSRGILGDLAFASKPIRWVIVLNSAGELVGQGPIETQGEKNRGKGFSAPRTSRPKDVGGVAEFLADGITSVFGLDTDLGAPLSEKQRKDRDANNEKKLGHFWKQIEDARAATTKKDEFAALLAFHRAIGNAPPFLRWGKALDGEDRKPRWWVRSADGGEVKMGPDQFTFQVGDKIMILEEAVREYWRTRYAGEVAEREGVSQTGLCLVTGTDKVPIASTHFPKIKGVPGTQSFGAAIVSFDKPAFTSYGFEQSLNAPVSTAAVDAYCNGLNTLLRADDHSLSLGDAVLCFWARDNKETSGFFARMLNRPDPKSVADFLSSPWAGLDRTLAKRDLLFSVTLSGNAGRVVVRHWMQQTVEEAVENFRHWFEDLNIMQFPNRPERVKKRRSSTPSADGPAPSEKAETPPLALFRLACATVREAKDLTSETSAQLYRAALERTAPSVMLLKPILHRLDADLHKHGRNTLLTVSRFALLKLILNRNRKETDPMIQCQVFETDDKPYNCGRLLAVLSEIQAKAHDFKLEGPGVAERYFGSGSSSPSSVFPLLLRLNRHHLDKLGKSERYASHRKPLEDTLREVLCHFRPDREGDPPQFPRTLELQAQGRFAIGFYQQQAKSAHDRDEAVRAKAAREAPAK